MASEIKVDTIFNAGGDNDTGIDLATNDQILLKVANATKLTMNSTGQTTIVGEGGTTTTSVQQGLCKAWAHTTQASSYVLDDSFNVASIADAGTGKTTININNDMANATYAVGGCCTQESVVIASVAAGSFEGRSIANDGSLADSTDFTISIHGDLA